MSELPRIIVQALLLVALVVGGVVVGRKVPDSFWGETRTTIIGRGAIVERVQHVNKQTFIEHYNAVDVHYSEAPDGWIRVFGIKQEFVVLVRGRVPAGFDLQEVSEDDVWISADGQRAQLTLPAPTIFEENVGIDFENSYILGERDTCPSFICEDDLTAYQGQVLPAGRDLLVDYARRHGILEQAAVDGQAYYEELLRTFGFEDVRVVVRGYDL
jgi:hypothetical protein